MATTILAPRRRSGRRILGMTISLGMVAVLGMLVSSRPFVDQNRVASTADTARIPVVMAAATPPDLSAIPGATTDWWSAVTASIEKEEYRFTDAESGLQAPNRAQNFRSR